MERTFRFSNLPWYQSIQNKKVLVVGAGGIGSWTCLFLSRLFENTGVSVIDFDTLDEYNLGGQFYSQKQIGQLKVSALGESLFANYGGYIDTFAEEIQSFDLNLHYYNYIVIAVDNMHARKHVFKKVQEFYNMTKRFIPFIDGRLLAESYQILTVSSPELLDAYEKTLFGDDEVPDAACSAKATSHCGASIGADITGLIVNMETNQFCGDDIREVPFMISKHFDLMLYDIEIPKAFQAETV